MTKIFASLKIFVTWVFEFCHKCSLSCHKGNNAMQDSKVKVDIWLCLKDLIKKCAKNILFGFCNILKNFFGIWSFQIYLLQTPPAPSAPPAPPASPAPTGEAQAYILIFIPDYGCFILEQQVLGKKRRVFVCSELFWALESNETLFPFEFLGCHFSGTNNIDKPITS